jgi:uncharacterized protein
MDKEIIFKLTKNFEDFVNKKDGIEFWFARDLQNLLGYFEWRKFLGVIKKAKESCKNSEVDYSNHFVNTAKMVSLGSGSERKIDDYMLTRYACYLIAQNGDPRKEEIAFAQTYFAIQTQKQELIEETIKFVKQTLSDAESGHNWWHTYRVWKLSKFLAEGENVNHFVIELGALLHDIADYKFHDGDENIGPKKARQFLISLNVDKKIIEHVEKIIKNISFKGNNNFQKFKSSELDIIQDADRLDAIGAIGISRTFNYGGFKNREIYDPNIKPLLNMSKEEYKNNTSPTINHFYEKLLLLKDKMNTKKGKIIAEEKHKFMEIFLNQFYKEWNF